MTMFKGVSTFKDYEGCLKRGLCEEHIKELGPAVHLLSQRELAELKDEFPRKAFRFIRINILYPLLLKKSPKLEKIKQLMEKTPALSKILLGGDISEAANTIFILDSVIIFTLCQLSQICCIGALFHIKKKASDDGKIKPLRQLLLVDKLDQTIVQFLYSILEKNFVGYDEGIIKASHIITLIFVRNFCTKFTMKTAIEYIENDIKGDKGWERFKAVADDYFKKGKIEEASKSYFSALFQNSYSPVLYSQLANCYNKLKNFRAGQLYAYLSISMKPTSSEAYAHFIMSLLHQKEHEEASKIVRYAIDVCEKSESTYPILETLRDDPISFLDFNEEFNKLRRSVQKITDHTAELLGEINEPSEKPMSVKLIESDSAESEDECEVSKKTAELVNADSSDESEIVEKKPVINMQEKTKSKSSGTNKKKRTLSEGLPDIPVEEEMDVAKINAFLKEASEALLADCGYKAVQLFRGPLRSFMDSSKFFSFEECDIVCIKYSYGIAYCKSGGYDDLQKCITILKDIIENHESITFPAAYYSLGLAYRKLNRFKESLNYLEIVQNFLQKGIHFKVYPWPGMTTVIQETKPDVLKALVQDLIKECENPPNPDAFCRYVNCEYQPPIYYTDPDFKGYITLSCSEQCCMQYHFLCWKAMKTEKELTEKEFLEKACFTPDCEGVIIKIQNIDRKGDLSKEFTSDFKKHTKQKWAKWEKKSESKEKKRKKVSNKSEEISNGSERNSSNADEESPPPQLSGCGSLEETNISENAEKSLKVKRGTEFDEEHQNNIVDSSPENSTQISNASSVEDNKEFSNEKQVQENEPEFYLNECIKNNVYSFMDDFLQHHGPLKVDDPLLTDEIESFPEEVHIIIAQCGGIGEFLKEDLRFAYVGDMYVCVVSDLATAYKMCSSSSLPTDFKSLQSLENTDSKVYNKCNIETAWQNTSLNPDAMEYTPPSANKSSCFKFVSNNSHSPNLNTESPAFVPAALDLSSAHETSGDTLSTFSEPDICVNKLENSEDVLDEKLHNFAEPVTSLHSKTGEDCDNSDNDRLSERTYQPALSSESLSSDSKLSNGCVSENMVPNEDSSLHSFRTTNLEFHLLNTLKLYYSEYMKPHRQKIDAYIKPFVIKRMPELAAVGSMTDFELVGESPSKVEMNLLADQNSLLREKLETASQKEQQLSAEVAQLQKHFKEIEVLKKEYEDKEQKLLDGREYLLESLTNAHETIDKQKQKLALVTEEKNSLQKTIDNLTVSLQKSEEKMNTLDAKEKHFNNTILKLETERDELRNRAKCAELLVLQLKKTEYLKKIEEKSAEAAKRRKDFSDGLSMISSNLNPMVQSDMKALLAQLLTYINNLKSIKVDFTKKIDEEIEKVKNDTPLKEIKEVEMKDLPEIPCWKYAAPANGRALDKQSMNPGQLPFNFGLNMATSCQAATSTFKPPVIPDTPVIPATNIPPTKTVPAAAAVGSSPATVVPPALSSGPKSNSNSKTELSNGSIDFSLNSQIEESFKTAMASINSFASTPYFAPSLDEEFRKNCVVFKHTDPVPTNKPEIPKVPPGIQNLTIPTTTRRTLLPDPIAQPISSTTKRPLLPDPIMQPISSCKENKFDTLDTVPIPIVNSESAHSSTWDLEKKKTASTKNSYEKLLKRLKEHFPQYNQEELKLFVIEFRAKREGKLSGLPMDTIINEISKLIMEKKIAEKKVSEARVLPKSTKVLVNKKLVPDPKPPLAGEQQQSVKKKTAWGNLDLDSKRRFSGSMEDDCIICYDSMTSSSAYKVSCGHAFHEKCIRQWLETQSNCPVCRMLLLLPEEYPSLP